MGQVLEKQSKSNFVDLSVFSSMASPGLMLLVSSLVLHSQEFGGGLKQYCALPLMHKWFCASHSYCKKVAWGMVRADSQEPSLFLVIEVPQAERSSKSVPGLLVNIFAHSFLIQFSNVM